VPAVCATVDFGRYVSKPKIGGAMSHSLSEETIRILDAIAGILLRCFIITVLASLFVWIVVLTMGDFLHQIYTLFLDISKREFDLWVLYSLTFTKALNVLFFLFPFVAIKHYLRGKKQFS
jgi:hypothetical protein